MRKLVPSCSPLPFQRFRKKTTLPSIIMTRLQDGKPTLLRIAQHCSILKHPTFFCCSSRCCSLEIPQKSLGPDNMTHPPPSYESEAPLDLTRPVDRNTPSTFADFPLQRRHGPRCPGKTPKPRGPFGPNQVGPKSPSPTLFFWGGGGFSQEDYILFLGKCL